MFEGELTQADLEEVKMGLREIINEEEDMVVIYRLRSADAMKREVLGMEKSSMDEVI